MPINPFALGPVPEVTNPHRVPDNGKIHNPKKTQK